MPVNPDMQNINNMLSIPPSIARQNQAEYLALRPYVIVIVDNIEVRVAAITNWLIKSNDSASFMMQKKAVYITTNVRGNALLRNTARAVNNDSAHKCIDAGIISTM